MVDKKGFDPSVRTVGRGVKETRIMNGTKIFASTFTPVNYHAKHEKLHSNQ